MGHARMEETRVCLQSPEMVKAETDSGMVRYKEDGHWPEMGKRDMGIAPRQSGSCSACPGTACFQCRPMPCFNAVLPMPSRSSHRVGIRSDWLITGALQ